MANQITKRRVERWLLEHGFTEEPGKPGGHRHFSDGRIKLTLAGHGPQEITRKHIGLIVRELERAGYDKRRVAAELRSGTW